LLLELSKKSQTNQIILVRNIIITLLL